MEVDGSDDFFFLRQFLGDAELPTVNFQGGVLSFETEVFFDF